jgi:hypothetical protein
MKGVLIEYRKKRKANKRVLGKQWLIFNLLQLFYLTSVQITSIGQLAEKSQTSSNYFI